ncbi:MAG: polysaccharide deacetylase family protein [Oscillospiraceae bacterium]|nr:polysaccharide deacetylase family protein [Oscillospiraceae bacterium]
MMIKKIAAAVTVAAALTLSSIPMISPSDVFASDENNTKLIALTFDDGPNTTTTNDILDLLEEYNAKASFFLIGTNINENSAATVKRAYDMGMEIDNHSKTHSNMSKMSAAEMQAEIAFVDEKVEEIIGEKTKFFRPPFIDVSAEMYNAIDLPFICGIDCQDYKAEVTAQERADYILNGATDGVIVLLHDAAGNQQTVEALEIAMPLLIEQGYEFVTLTELFERQGQTPKHGIIYSNVGKYPTGYQVKETISAGDIDRISLDRKMLEELGDTYAIEMDYSSATGYTPVLALQKWSGTPTIWHPIQPAYFDGDKAVFLAGDVLDALEQLELGYNDLDGMLLIAYTGDIVLSDVKLLTKSGALETSIAGDVNKDGAFNLKDIILFQKWLLAVPDTHLADWKAADMNKDNELDVFDLCLMKRELLSDVQFPQ